MLTFAEANKLDNAGFAQYVEEVNAAWRLRMIAEGMIYFPELNRWFPAGTQIAGCAPEIE